MKWIILGLMAVGGVFCIIGSREINNRNQSADVRAGGSLPIIFGLACVVWALILAFIAFLWTL